MFRNSSYFLLVLVLFIMSACKTKQKVATVAYDPKSPESVLNKIEAIKPAYEWFSATGRIQVESSEQSIGGTAIITMQHNKLVWVSLRKFGFEAVRVKVTPDSIYYLNRLEKEYAAESISLLEEKTGLPPRFSYLEDVILGSGLYITRENMQVQTQTDSTLLWLGKDSRYANSILFNPVNNQIIQQTFNDTAEKSSLQVNQRGYKSIQSIAAFSTQRLYQLDSPHTDGKASVDIEWTQIEIDQPKPVNFEIPPSYTRVRWN